MAKHVIAALMEYRAQEHPEQVFLKMDGVRQRRRPNARATRT